MSTIRNPWSIRYLCEKLKPYAEVELLYTAVCLLLVAVSSFFLGRSSVSDPGNGSTITMSQASAVPLAFPDTTPSASSTPGLAADVATVSSTTARYVASKSGTKYHFTTCPGAKQIKDSNKIYFATPQEAAAAGYSKAANCPGL